MPVGAMWLFLTHSFCKGCFPRVSTCLHPAQPPVMRDTDNIAGASRIPPSFAVTNVSKTSDSTVPCAEQAAVLLPCG